MIHRTMACTVVVFVALFLAAAVSAQSALPSPWAHQDIGNVGLEGNATFADGVFTIEASGSDIAGTSDHFHFVYQPLSGDGSIVARVVEVEVTRNGAKAGVMIRESLASDARMSFGYVRAGGSVYHMWRNEPAQAVGANRVQGIAAPVWLKLERSGDTFSLYHSSDGEGWQLVETAVVAMAKDVYVGLAVTAFDNEQLNTTVIDSVQVTP